MLVDGTPRGRADHSGWSIAAALGLLAAAFLVERFAPLEDEIHPPQAEAKRDTSAAGLAAEGDGRGRSATSPSEIPAKGWKDILWRVYGKIGEHRILALAAGTTYYIEWDGSRSEAGSDSRTATSPLVQSGSSSNTTDTPTPRLLSSR